MSIRVNECIKIRIIQQFFGIIVKTHRRYLSFKVQANNKLRDRLYQHLLRFIALKR